MRILTRAAGNALRAASSHPDQLVIDLHQVTVNHTGVGCSGFVKDRATGNVVYVSTEESVYGPLRGKVLWRRVDEPVGTRHALSGPSHGSNHFSPADDWAEDVVADLERA